MVQYEGEPLIAFANSAMNIEFVSLILTGFKVTMQAQVAARDNKISLNTDGDVKYLRTSDLEDEIAGNGSLSVSFKRQIGKGFLFSRGKKPEKKKPKKRKVTIVKK